MLWFELATVMSQAMKYDVITYTPYEGLNYTILDKITPLWKRIGEPPETKIGCYRGHPGQQGHLQSRRHGGGFGGLAPPNKAPSPPKLKHEHYKSVEILSILECLAPPHKPKALPQKRKAPLLKTFWRRFWSLGLIIRCISLKSTFILT